MASTQAIHDCSLLGLLGDTRFDRGGRTALLNHRVIRAAWSKHDTEFADRVESHAGKARDPK